MHVNSVPYWHQDRITFIISHFTSFIKYYQLRDWVFHIELLHIFVLIGSVSPQKEASQMDKSDIICHRDYTEAGPEQSAGDTQCVPHLLLSQHRKTANFYVNVAMIGTKYAEFLFLLQVLFCQTTNLFFPRTPCSWEVEQKSLSSHITREKYLKTQYSKCYVLCKTDFCTVAPDTITKHFL